MIMNIIFFATMYPIVFIMLFLFSTQNKYENGRLFAVNMKKEWIKDATVADIRQKFKKEMRYYAILLAIVPFVSLLTSHMSIQLTIWMFWLLAAIFLGEGITALKALAMVLIGGGAYLMIQRAKPAVASASGAAAENTAAPTANRGKSPAWLLYAVGSAVFASLTAILGKIGIENVNSTLGTAIRTGVVLVMAWSIVFMRGKQREVGRIDRRSLVFLVLSGFATGGSWLCYYGALQTGPASVVVPIDKLSILVSIAFSRVVFGERLTAKAGAGLGLLVCGTLLLLVK